MLGASNSLSTIFLLDFGHVPSVVLFVFNFPFKYNFTFLGEKTNNKNKQKSLNKYKLSKKKA